MSQCPHLTERGSAHPRVKKRKTREPGMIAWQVGQAVSACVGETCVPRKG